LILNNPFKLFGKNGKKINRTIISRIRSAALVFINWNNKCSFQTIRKTQSERNQLISCTRGETITHIFFIRKVDIPKISTVLDESRERILLLTRSIEIGSHTSDSLPAFLK